MGACNPLQWRNRPRFSRGSLDLTVLSDGHASIHFKERRVDKSVEEESQEKTEKTFFA
jgi:hypothetical protein